MLHTYLLLCQYQVGYDACVRNLNAVKQHYSMLADTNAVGVTLRVYGPQVNDSSIHLCPDHDYILVVHCNVTKSFSSLWALPPFVDPSITFIRSHKLGKFSRPPVTVVLTEKKLTNSDINSYELQVSTGALIRAIADQGGRPLDVICQAGAVQKRISIFAKGLL